MLNGKCLLHLDNVTVRPGRLYDEEDIEVSEHQASLNATMRPTRSLDWKAVGMAILVRLVIYSFAIFVIYYALSRQIKLYSVHIICMAIGVSFLLCRLIIKYFTVFLNSSMS